MESRWLALAAGIWVQGWWVRDFEDDDRKEHIKYINE